MGKRGLFKYCRVLGCHHAAGSHQGYCSAHWKLRKEIKEMIKSGRRKGH